MRACRLEPNQDTGRLDPRVLDAQELGAWCGQLWQGHLPLVHVAGLGRVLQRVHGSDRLAGANTGLRHPQELTAWALPSPTSWMVVWCSTATGSSQVNHRAAHRPAHAVESLDPGGDQPGQLVDVPRLCPRNDAVGPGHACRLRDAGKPRSGAARTAALPASVWIRMYAAIT